MASGGSSKGQKSWVDWEEAYAIYASLPPGDRTYAAVAARVGCSVRTVETHGRAGRWQQRLNEISAKTAARTAEALVDARVEEIEKIRGLLDASLSGFAEQLREMRIAPADLERFNRLSWELIDEITNAYAPCPVAEATPPERTPEHTAAVLDALSETGVFETLGLARTKPSGADEPASSCEEGREP
jgi:hypothetical protein